MKGFSIKVNTSTLEALKQIYSKFLIENDSSDKNLFFTADYRDVTIKVYNDGTIFFYGASISNMVEQLITGLSLTDVEHIGISYYGLNDIFGPLCVCSVIATDENISFLEKLGILGKHKVSEILKLAPIIASRVKYNLETIEPAKFNEFNKEGISNNKLIATHINQCALKSSSEHSGIIPVFSEKILEYDTYINYLKNEKFIYSDISFIEKGYENILAIAAAKILCQYEYLARLSQYSSIYDIKLIPGFNEKAVSIFKNTLHYDNVLVEKRLDKISKLNNKKIYRLIKKNN